MKPISEHELIKELGDGLILRRSGREDRRALADFNMHIHLQDGQPDEGIGAWTRDLLRGDHPTFSPADFTLVEDTRTGRIVSACNLISQTWSYAGIPFGVGRPELVGTDPAYRRRGLVREQFKVLHQWSAERGEKVQAITGIPWYYRQFGYEMLLTLDCGRAAYVPQSIPSLKKGETEPFRVRAAAQGDLPFVKKLYDEGNRRWLVASERNEALWKYELRGRSSKSAYNYRLWILETPAQEPVGFFLQSNHLGGPWLHVPVYEVKPGVSWVAVTPTVLRFLAAAGHKLARRDGKEFQAIMFWLGLEHPIYEAAPGRLPLKREPYAWYIRVPDVRGFIELIRPVLEQRLARSVLPGHTGALRVSFFRDGMRLVFEKGCLKAVEPWIPSPDEWGDCTFPDLTFLQLLFGFRARAELEHEFGDCITFGDEAKALLSALFPKQASNVWGIG